MKQSARGPPLWGEASTNNDIEFIAERKRNYENKKKI